jgi:hypothetical protein
MKLSTLAGKILDDPMQYLDLDHGQKHLIESEHIWTLKHSNNKSVRKVEFVEALDSIRGRASQRGVNVPQKDLVHNSIRRYALKVRGRFSSLNQLNNHLKGLYGCELPKKFRVEFQALFQGETLTHEPVLPQQTKDVVGQTHITLGGLDFTLTDGSSLTIGELSTESLNLVGLKSIKIDKVANGRLYGVCLEA